MHDEAARRGSLNRRLPAARVTHTRDADGAQGIEQVELDPSN
jgi:hypothetical protein